MYQPDTEQMMFMQGGMQPQPQNSGPAFWMNYIKQAYENAAAARQNRPPTDGARTPPIMEHPPAPQMPVHQTKPTLELPGRGPQKPVLNDSRVPGIQPIRPRFGALPYGGYTNA